MTKILRQTPFLIIHGLLGKVVRHSPARGDVGGGVVAAGKLPGDGPVWVPGEGDDEEEVAAERRPEVPLLSDGPGGGGWLALATVGGWGPGQTCPQTVALSCVGMELAHPVDITVKMQAGSVRCQTPPPNPQVMQIDLLLNFN